MDIFVMFEIWNLTSKRFEPVRSMPVDLMDSNDVFSDSLIGTVTTDSAGFAHFSVTEADLKQKSGEDKPDLYFNARCKGLTYVAACRCRRSGPRIDGTTRMESRAIFLIRNLSREAH
jgi:hypothetical protein